MQECRGKRPAHAKKDYFHTKREGAVLHLNLFLTEQDSCGQSVWL